MIQLRHCTIYPEPYGALIVFNDGAVSSNWPPTDPAFARTALACGFTSPLAYVREHELSHTFLAERFFDAPSAVQWAAAHHLAYDGRWEERWVYHWQRFVADRSPGLEPEWRGWLDEFRRLAGILAECSVWTGARLGAESRAGVDIQQVADPVRSTRDPDTHVSAPAGGPREETPWGRPQDS